MRTVGWRCPLGTARAGAHVEHAGVEPTADETDETEP